MKKITRLRLFAICLAFVLLGESTSLFAADRTLGTWKLSVSKSRYRAGRAPKVRVLKCTANGNGVKFRTERLSAEGSIEYAALYDGKDYPVKWAEEYETVSVRQMDDNTVESIYKRNGRVVGTSKRVVSTNGDEMTVTSTGRSPEGEDSDEVVYQKQ